MPEIKVLDCTLRDGGYYNNWSFSEEIVTEYLDAMEQSKVDIVEIGLRSTCNDKFLGPFAFSTDEFLRSINIDHHSFKLAVMINASDYIKNESANLDLLISKFTYAKSSPVDIVRIACHFKEINSVLPLANKLKDLGYTVGLNLMQISNQTDEAISNTVKEISSWQNVDVLYFADSLGNLNSQQIDNIIKIFKSNWMGEIGIHTHDNMSNAISNSITAMKSDVTWIDGTVLGMGRGAGNSRTEFLLLEIQNFTKKVYSPTSLFPIVMGSFKKLHDKHSWGPSLLYYLSAKYNVHPSYVQEMANVDFGSDKILSAMEKLKEENALSFNHSSLTEALNFHQNYSKGNWSPEELFKGRDVLVLGGGPGVKDHSKAIEKYIIKNNPVTISLNINKSIAENLITAYAASHPMRIMSDSSKYRLLKRPLITPLGSLNEDISKSFKDIETYDFGIKIKKDTFNFLQNSCEIPSPLVLGYVLAAVSSGGAKKVLLAGFDGYSIGDSRREEVDKLFCLYSDNLKTPDLISITPTVYNINQSSVYSPDL